MNNTDKSRKRTREAKRILKDIIYPHNIHPALVPGVSIEDQKVKYGVDKPILIVVGSLIVAFVAWGIFAPEQVFNASSAALDWVMRNLGWIFTTLATFLMFVLLILAFSKYGKIPLGVDGEKPEFSTVSWAAMLFGAGIGIGIIFFGPFEPLSYYLSPRPGAYEAASDEAVMGAMAQAAMHWGINAWAIYAIVGLCVAYVSYRRGRVPLMSSILMPLFGNRDTDSVPARIIDGLAIIATLFGTAATLGIGALQDRARRGDCQRLVHHGQHGGDDHHGALHRNHLLRGLWRVQGHSVAVQHQPGPRGRAGRLLLCGGPHGLPHEHAALRHHRIPR